MCDNIFHLFILYLNNLFFKSKYEKGITLTILRKIDKKSCLKEKVNFHIKIIFLNYLKFYNVKQEMSLGKVICPSL